jgi:hypothetical protein
MVKPEFWDDEKLARLSRGVRLLFIGLWTYSDDFGVVKGSPVWLKSKIFPYDQDLAISEFSKWMDDLEESGFVASFVADDEKYYYILNFNKHQRVDHPSTQRNPEPPKGIGSRKPRESSRKSRAKSESESESETEYKQKPNLKSSCPALQPDAVDVRVVQLLIDLMLANNPESSTIRRLTPKSQSEWINQARLLRTADKRTPEQIEAIIRFSQADQFWKGNILSMPKLREQWDKLVMKARRSDRFDGIREWLNEPTAPKENTDEAER